MVAFGLHMLQASGAVGGHGAGRFPAIMALVLTMLAWQWRGYRLARPAIHAELARRAARVRPEPYA